MVAWWGWWGKLFSGERARNERTHAKPSGKAISDRLWGVLSKVFWYALGEMIEVLRLNNLPTILASLNGK